MQTGLVILPAGRMYILDNDITFPVLALQVKTSGLSCSKRR